MNLSLLGFLTWAAGMAAPVRRKYRAPLTTEEQNKRDRRRKRRKLARSSRRKNR